MSERAFAPPSSHALTYGVMDGTFGASFTRSGRFVAARTAETTLHSTSGSCPKVCPPALTLGQLTFISIASTASPIRAATSAYSSIVPPQMLAIMGTSGTCFRYHGTVYLRKCSTPVPCRPMAFTSPPGTSAWRGIWFPGQGSSRMPFAVTAPSFE